MQFVGMAVCSWVARCGLSCCGQGFRGPPATLGAHPARSWGDAGTARMEVPVPDSARAMRGATGQSRRSGGMRGRHPAEVSQCGSSAFTSRGRGGPKGQGTRLEAQV